jgi:glycerol kinase
MQFLADVIGVPATRPIVSETVSLGAAYSAGLAVGFWPDIASLKHNWHRAAEWVPKMDPAKRDRGYRKWKKAVSRAVDWLDDDD